MESLFDFVKKSIVQLLNETSKSINRLEEDEGNIEFRNKTFNQNPIALTIAKSDLTCEQLKQRLDSLLQAKQLLHLYKALPLEHEQTEEFNAPDTGEVEQSETELIDDYLERYIDTNNLRDNATTFIHEMVVRNNVLNTEHTDISELFTNILALNKLEPSQLAQIKRLKIQVEKHTSEPEAMYLKLLDDLINIGTFKCEYRVCNKIINSNARSSSNIRVRFSNVDGLACQIANNLYDNVQGNVNYIETIVANITTLTGRANLQEYARDFISQSDNILSEKKRGLVTLGRDYWNKYILSSSDISDNLARSLGFLICVAYFDCQLHANWVRQIPPEQIGNVFTKKNLIKKFTDQLDSVIWKGSGRHSRELSLKIENVEQTVNGLYGIYNLVKKPEQKLKPTINLNLTPRLNSFYQDLLRVIKTIDESYISSDGASYNTYTSSVLKARFIELEFPNLAVDLSQKNNSPYGIKESLHMEEFIEFLLGEFLGDELKSPLSNSSESYWGDEFKSELEQNGLFEKPSAEFVFNESALNGSVWCKGVFGKKNIGGVGKDKLYAAFKILGGDFVDIGFNSGSDSVSNLNQYLFSSKQDLNKYKLRNGYVLSKEQIKIFEKLKVIVPVLSVSVDEFDESTSVIYFYEFGKAKKGSFQCAKVNTANVPSDVACSENKNEEHQETLDRDLSEKFVLKTAKPKSNEFLFHKLIKHYAMENFFYYGALEEQVNKQGNGLVSKAYSCVRKHQLNLIGLSRALYYWYMAVGLKNLTSIVNAFLEIYPSDNKENKPYTDFEDFFWEPDNSNVRNHNSFFEPVKDSDGWTVQARIPSDKFSTYVKQYIVFKYSAKKLGYEFSSLTDDEIAIVYSKAIPPRFIYLSENSSELSENSSEIEFEQTISIEWSGDNSRTYVNSINFSIAGITTVLGDNDYFYQALIPPEPLEDLIETQLVQIPHAVVLNTSIVQTGYFVCSLPVGNPTQLSDSMSVPLCLKSIVAGEHIKSNVDTTLLELKLTDIVEISLEQVVLEQVVKRNLEDFKRLSPDEIKATIGLFEPFINYDANVEKLERINQFCSTFAS